MRTRLAVSGWLFVLAAGAALAQPGPAALDRAEQDRRTARVVHEANALGTDLFNRGSRAECYRLFQGTLLAVEPMLDHRPKLALYVKEQLDKAAKMAPDSAIASLELRKALDIVQAETATAIAPEKGTTGKEVVGKEGTPKEISPKAVTPKDPLTTDKAASLWDRLGGESGVRPFMKDLITELAAEPKVNFTRNGKYKLDDKATKRMEQTMVELLSEVSGGPLKYSGKNLAEVHEGMKVTRDEYAYFNIVLDRVITKHDLKLKERFELSDLINKARPLIVEKEVEKKDR